MTGHRVYGNIWEANHHGSKHAPRSRYVYMSDTRNTLELLVKGTSLLMMRAYIFARNGPCNYLDKLVDYIKSTMHIKDTGAWSGTVVWRRLPRHVREGQYWTSRSIRLSRRTFLEERASTYTAHLQSYFTTEKMCDDTQ